MLLTLASSNQQCLDCVTASQSGRLFSSCILCSNRMRWMHSAQDSIAQVSDQLVHPVLPTTGKRACMQDEGERKALVAELHRLKTDIFMDLVQRGTMPLRPGVQRLVRECPLGHR